MEEASNAIPSLAEARRRGKAFISFRNPADDVVGQTIKDSAAQLRAAGKPLFLTDTQRAQTDNNRR